MFVSFSLQDKHKEITLYKCDRFEQKQADGCVLTNPLNAMPLHPDSTFIDGFSWAIHQKMVHQRVHLCSDSRFSNIKKI